MATQAKLPTRLHHNAYVSRDLEATREFYEDVIGLPLLATWCEKDVLFGAERTYCHCFFGLGDGGAHAGQTCDASTTTFLLTHWARDRAEGRLPLELAVHKTTQATATLYGLGDRGVLAPGYVGDANVIDFDRLTLHRPVKVADLPGGASRLIQRADG